MTKKVWELSKKEMIAVKKFRKELKEVEKELKERVFTRKKEMILLALED